jgi:hypothetical protein
MEHPMNTLLSAIARYFRRPHFASSGIRTGHRKARQQRKSFPSCRKAQARAGGPLNRGPLHLEILEDRTLLSTFYNLTTLASTGGSSQFTSFGDLVSVNDAGTAVFVGSTSQGSGLYVVQTGQTTPVNINPSFSDDPTRSFGRGAAINDDGFVSAVDRYSAPDYTQFTARRWDSNNPDSNVILSKLPATQLGAPDSKYQTLQTFTDINYEGDIVFDSLYGTSVQVSNPPYEAVQRVKYNNVGLDTYTTIDKDLPVGVGNPAPRPQLGVLGEAVYYSSKDRAIEVVDQYGSSQVIVSGSKGGFTRLGDAPGTDGNIVVFTGDRGNGPGVFAVYRTGGAWSQPIRVAGEGKDGFISFDSESAVQVGGGFNGLEPNDVSDRGVTIAFVGTQQNEGTGLYTARLSLFSSDPVNFNVRAITSTVVSGVEPVAQYYDRLSDGKLINQIRLWHGIDEWDRGRLTFWVQTTDGTQEILRADPNQVVYLDFNPSDASVVGQAQKNLDLLKDVGVKNIGLVGSMKDTLSGLGLTTDYNALQTAVVNAVQQMFTASGARVNVVAQAPVYIPEPEFDASGHLVMAGGAAVLSGTYKTIYVGGAPVGSTDDLGMASRIDFFNQFLDDTAFVFVNNVFQSASQSQIVEAISVTIAHEAGHTFGLYHLDPAFIGDVMHGGTTAGEFNSPQAFEKNALPVEQLEGDNALESVTESSANRLLFATGVLGGVTPNSKLLAVSTDDIIQAKVGLPAGNSLNVKDVVVGIRPLGGDDFMPRFEDLGAGDLATLLNNASIPAGPDDTVLVLGSTDGTNLDVVSVAKGQEGAQNSLSATGLGVMADTRLYAPLSGPGAALHFYHLTASGPVDLGLANLSATVPNHTPVLASISNQAVASGTPVTFTAGATDADTGETLTYSLDPGAPIGASINATTGAFAWTPTAAQAGQVYSITVRVTDNGSPPASDTQSFVVNVLNRLAATAVTEITTPNPGPMQIAVDFNEALQLALAQTVSNYKIVSQGGISLPIQSAVYSDTGTQHRVVLTVAAGTTVVPDVYHVLIDAANLSATNGDQGEPKADQLWVDVTGENTLKPITVQPDGSFAVSGSGQVLGYPPPSQVIAGNFTGSAYADLVVLTSSAAGTSGQLLLLKNTGDGTYASPVPISVGKPGDVIEYVGTIDWNHDGSPDLVVGTANAPFDLSYASGYSYYVLLNDGHGNFTNAPETPISLSGTSTINYYHTDPFDWTSFYDLSGTGQYDIIHLGLATDVAGNAVYRTLEVIGKDPFLGYTAQMELDLGPQGASPSTTPALFTDLNGDGKPDIILREAYLYQSNTDNFNVILSTLTGYATGQEIQCTNGFDNAAGDFVPLQGPLAVGVGHFSGSGYNDIAAVYAGAIQIYQNDGTGNFTDPAPIMLDSADTVRAATFADLNGDGIPDLVVVEEPNSASGAEGVTPLAVWTFLADGHGGFSRTTPAPIPLATTDESIPTSMVLADVDGDGNPDVVLGSSQLGVIRLAINDGSGTMRPPSQPLPFLGSIAGSTVAGVSAQVFADFNNSGHMGFATLTPGGVDVYVGESDGGFKHTTFLPTPPGALNAWIKIGDLNNDGIPDIVIGGLSPYGSSMAVYLGNGDGTFRPAPTFLPQASGYSTANATLADVNHDGNLDAVATLVGNGFSGFWYGVFFGDGKGNLTFNINTLVPIALFTINYVHPLSATLADFNGDGKLDLLVPTAGFNLTDYLGNGNGTFTPGPIIYTGSSESDTQELTADLNGDGNLDLVTVTDATARIYLGDGHGGFQQTDSLNLSVGSDGVGQPIPPADVALGQFMGDGSYYLAVSDDNSYYPTAVDGKAVKLYKIDATGHFGPAQTVMVGAGPGSLVSIPRAPFLDAGTFAVTDHGPVAKDATASVVSGTSVSIPVLLYDTDPDNAPLTITAVSTPGHGFTHIDPTDGSVVYAPAAGFTGTDSFTYTIADPAGVEATATVMVTVTSITITPASLPSAQVGVNYSQQLTASGGAGPYTFTISSGTLPAGLSLSSGGLLTGTPTVGGSFTFTAQVTDSTNSTGNQSFTLIVNQPPAFTSANTTTFIVGQSGSFTVTASGFPTPALSENSTDALPSGVTFNGTTGVLSGTPAAGGGGTYILHFTAHNGTGSDATQTFTLTIETPQALAFTSASGAIFTVGQSGHFTVAASGFPNPTLSESASDALPSGVSFNASSGVLSGTPGAATPGTYTLHFTAHNGVGSDATQSFTLTVTPPSSIAGLTVPVLTAIAGTPFSGLVASFTDPASTLPAASFTVTILWGNGQTSTGTVSGGNGSFTVSGSDTYTGEGRYPLSVTVSDPFGNAATRSGLVHVARVGPPPGGLAFVANTLTHSFEYYARVVTAAYLNYLGRAPAPSEVAGWVGVMQQGLSDEQLEAGFIGAPEFIADNGGLGSGWVTGLYQKLLGRNPAPSEVAGWVNALQGGMTPAAIAYGFAASPEREAQRITADYQRYLNRTPEPGIVAAWVNAFVNGFSNEDVIAGFVGSIEYFQKHYDNIPDWLFSAYDDVLGRDPEPAALQGWTQFLQNS